MVVLNLRADGSISLEYTVASKQKGMVNINEKIVYFFLGKFFNNNYNGEKYNFSKQ
mgnify:FL=1